MLEQGFKFVLSGLGAIAVMCVPYAIATCYGHPNPTEHMLCVIAFILLAKDCYRNMK